MNDYKNIHDMLREIDERGEGLTGWEIMFVADMIDKPRASFSPKQIEIIDRIYNDRIK